MVVGGAAIIRLGTIVKAWLVGLHREIEPALRQCHAWLKESIESQEDLRDINIPALRSGAFGLTQWMLDAQNDTVSYSRALDEFETYFKSGGAARSEPRSIQQSY